MKETKSFCRLCLGTCGVVVTTDDRDRLVQIRGDKDHPVTSGYTCFTGLQSPDAHNSPRRLLRPLKRLADGSFVEIGLEQALDEIAARLLALVAESGPRSVAGFRGTANYNNTIACAMLPAWLSALGSPAFFSTMTVDQSAKWVSIERLGSWAAGRQNFDDSDVVLLIGGNPLVSATVPGFPCANPVKRIKEARARGLKLIVIDPRMSETAMLADIVLQPLPGEDVAVVGGLLHIILANGWEDRDFCAAHVNGLDELRHALASFHPHYVEQRSGVPAASLYVAAEAFAKTARRGFAVSGTGPDMGPFSNLAEHLIETLNVVCGRFRREGDRVLNPVLLGPRSPRYATAISPARSWERGPKSRLCGTGLLFGEMMTCEMADEILSPGEGRIRSLIVAGGNPMGALADPRKTERALAELDLLVTIDPFLTATARMSHYVLPPKLQYERADVAGNHELIPAAFAQYTNAIAAPPEGSEVADEWYVLWGLARRMGLPLELNQIPVPMDRMPSSDALLAQLTQGAQVPLEKLCETLNGLITDHERQFVEAAPEGAVGRFELLPADVAAEIEAALGEVLPPGYTHRLSVRRMRGVINTAYHDLPEVRRRAPFNPAFMNPYDLTTLGLRSGDRVELQSPYGRIPAIVEADPALRSGVVSMSHGWGKVLRDGGAEDPEAGSSTSFLVSADVGLETINSMVRLTGVPLNILPRGSPATTA